METITIATAHAAAVVAPHLGGRILSWQAGGREWLWRNPALIGDDLHPIVRLADWPTPTSMGTWANVGGDKTWPAPQGWNGSGEWSGPPDVVLDSGRYDVVERAADRLSVVVRSAADLVTGVQITRHIALAADAPALTVVSTLRNVSDREVRWSAWEVTQVRTQRPSDHPGDRVEVDVDEAGANVAVNLLELPPPIVERPRPDQAVVPIQECVGKLGFPSATGRIALRLAEGPAFVQEFAVDASSVYPDRGSRAEMWMQYPVDEPVEALNGLQPCAYLVELECLSPLTVLAPGEEVSLKVRWCIEP